MKRKLSTVNSASAQLSPLPEEKGDESNPGPEDNANGGVGRCPAGQRRLRPGGPRGAGAGQNGKAAVQNRQAVTSGSYSARACGGKNPPRPAHLRPDGACRPLRRATDEMRGLPPAGRKGGLPGA